MLVQRAATASSSRPICSTDACSPPIDVLAESLIVGDVLMSLMTFGETVLVWSAVKAWSAMAGSNGSTVSGGPSGKNSVIGRVPISFTLRRVGVVIGLKILWEPREPLLPGGFRQRRL